MAAPKSTDAAIRIDPIKTETIRICIVGESPLIQNRLAEKARQELLLPKGRKTAAEKAGSLKHNPVEEFRSSPYRIDDPEAPTLLALPTTTIKAAIMNAALDLPGAKKSQIGRLAFVEGSVFPVFGSVELLMSIVRSADMNRTPDVRTRAVMPQWAAEVSITFTTPILNETSIVNLASAAGQICGLGDWRPEKGKGSFGRYRLANPDDPEYQHIVNTYGRAYQIEAMEHPTPHDLETEELYSWFTEEAVSRGKLTRIA